MILLHDKDESFFSVKAQRRNQELIILLWKIPGDSVRPSLQNFDARYRS